MSACPIVDEMQTYYARRAPVYDASMGYDDPSTIASLEPVAAALRRRLAGRALLEIACGPGFWTRMVADVAASITATDYNESTLEQARDKRLDAAKVSFLVADAYDLYSVGRRFEGAFAVDWLAHVPSSRSYQFLDGLHRCLAPGAQVAFCDQLPGPESVSGEYDAEGNHLQRRALSDGSTYRVIKHFLSNDELRTMFALYTDDLAIERYPELRRIVVGYTWSPEGST